ncbi:uncharacterized protein LOC124254642 isoform X2 [Haliotis rubra]|uniref:uncharacterized protein LOC124254642 isoform X2 n=1 Tax=Haliotis rubra TaxID=36100 RepID=UPI001EE51B28|nr:uncharacterized protein LOC124254642 isoform X2 [Haliotis rubra]
MSSALSKENDRSKDSLTWTSKVKDVLGPDFAFVDEDRTRETTLRDLFTHRTGLQTAVLAIFAGFDRNFTSAKFAKRFRFLPEVQPFRDALEYNNWPYALLGRIVEVLSGESFTETLEKRIFKPLGMNQSRVLGKTITPNATGMAKPYFFVENKLTLTDPSIYDIHPGEAAGAIASSAEDMAKWMHFLLKQGVTEDNFMLVNPLTLAGAFQAIESVVDGLAMSKPAYPVMDLKYGYGYGWYISTYRGYKQIMHTGDLISYLSSLVLYPDLDIGIFISASGAGTMDEQTAERLISFYISDILTDDQPWLNSSTACAFPVLSPSQNNSDVTNSEVECLDCYVGKYGDYLFGDLDVRRGPGSSLELHYGRVRGSLNTTAHKSTFKLDVWDPLRFLSRPGNATFLIPVRFYGLKKGEYSKVDLGYKYTFSKGISVYDENIDTNTKTGTNGQGLKEVSHLLIVFGVICILLIM